MPLRACLVGLTCLPQPAKLPLNSTSYTFAISVSQTDAAPYITVKHQMSYYIVNQIYGGTNMGYHRDMLVTRIDPRLSFEQYDDHSYYRYIHVKGI